MCLLNLAYYFDMNAPEAAQQQPGKPAAPSNEISETLKNLEKFHFHGASQALRRSKLLLSERLEQENVVHEHEEALASYSVLWVLALARVNTLRNQLSTVAR